MALSDDVASLKLEIHKLAVAIEELAIKRYSQGEIGISNLPWFTPQYVPGDSIKLSGNRLPAATYLDNNEVIASPIASFPNASDKSLGAHQTFDEIPEPNTSLNQAQMVHETNPSILSKEATISCAHQMLDKFPEPISHLNQVPMLRNNGDNTRNHLIAGSSAMPCVKLAENEALPTLNFNAANELSSAHNMFDKLPVPTFILEMAQAAKTTQENEEMADAHQLFDAMPEPTEQANAGRILCQPAVINNENTPIQDDHFTHKQQLFAPLDALDASYFNDLVWNMISEPNCCYWFVFDPGVLLMHINRDDINDHTKLFEMINEWNANVNYKEVHSWGKLYVTLTWREGLENSIWSSTINYIRDVGVVTIKAKMSFVTPFYPTTVTLIFDLALNFNVFTVSPIKVDCYVKLTIQWHKHMLKTHTIFPLCQSEVKGMYFCAGETEEMHLSILTLEDKGNFRGEENHNEECTWELANKSAVLLTFVFDPGSSALHVGQLLMEVLNGLFIKKLFLLSCKSQLVLTLTLEDNNDFKDVGNDTSLALWWRTSSLIYARNHLIITHTILMTMTFTSFIFDPGGPYDKFWVVTFVSFPRVATSKECTIVWNFDPGGNTDLLGAMSSMSVSSMRDLFGIYNGGMNLMFSVYENAIVQSSEGSISLWLHNGSFIVHVEKISKALKHVSLKYVTELYLPLSLIIDSPSNYGNYFVLLLGYCLKSPSETIFIFDAGGNGDVSGCTTIALVGGIGLGLNFSAKPVFFMPSNGDLRLSMHFYVQQDWNFILEYLLVDEKYPCSCSTINLRRKVRFDDFEATYKSILLGRRSVDVKRMTNIDFEEVENDSVLALKRIQKHAVDHISISGRALMVTRVNSFGFDPGGVKYELYPSVLYVTILIFCAFKPGGNGDLSGVTGATRAEFVPLKTRQVTLMEATNAIPLILIFDPGGGVVRLKMTNRAPTHQYGGGTRLKGKGNEDHQIYVFDPGGQLMRFVIKAMVTNSQPGVYYAMSCFNFIDYL